MNILVTGAGGPAGICVIKSLRGKHRVIAADIDGLAPGLYLAHKGYIVPRANDKDLIPKIIRIAKKERVSMIMPTVEEELVHFSKNLDAFHRAGIKVVVSTPESLKMAMDKLETYTFFKDEPYGPKIYGASDIVYPAVVKPTDSRGGRGFYICENVQELKVALAKNSKHFKKSIVMEYVKGTEYSVYGMSGLDGRPIAIVPIKRIQASSESKKAQTVLDKAVIGAARDIATKLRIVGPWNIQIMKSGRRLKLIEVNARFAGTTSLIINAGINLPELAIAVFSGKASPKRELKFKDGVLMTRYNEEVFLTEKDVVKDVL